MLKPSRSLIVFVTILGSFLLIAPIYAQTVSTVRNYLSGGEGRPQISQTDLDVFVRVLSLEETEQEVLAALYREYATEMDASYNSVRDRVLDIVEEAMVLNDDARGEEAQEIINAWYAEKQEREETFLDELTLLLTDEQQSRWPLVERELRRIKQLHGVMAGEGVDVIKLAHAYLGTDVIDHPEVAQMLEQYSVELDRRLRDRIQYRRDNLDEFAEARGSDSERAVELWDRMRERRIALRNLHATWVRRIATAVAARMPEARDQVEAFEHAWLRACLGRRMDPTFAQRQLDSAVALEGIDEPTRAKLAEFKERIDAERVLLQRKLVPIVFAEQESLPNNNPNMAGTAFTTEQDFKGYEEGTPMASVAQELAALDREILTELRSTLTIEDRRRARDSDSITMTFRKDVFWTRF